MKKQVKWLWCVLAVLLLVSTLTLVSLAAEPTDPAALSIECFSLSLENAAYINFKVESAGVLDPGAIKILVWHEAPEAYEKGTEALCLPSLGCEDGTGYELFQYNDLAAKDMTKTVYVCAYVDQNGQQIYSAPAKFSVVMYAYLKKHAETPDTDLVALLDSMLAYGAQAQQYFCHNVEWLATDEMGEVSVVGGKLSDGFSLGWYKKGTTVTLTANAPEEGLEFSHWENGAGEQVSTDAVFEAPVGEGDQIYTAVYKELGASQGSSQGLAFTSNNDGTCYVSGIGTCTDTDVVIPDVSPDGDRVTGIGSNAFMNHGYVTGADSMGQVTSITIPASVTSIGHNAFYGCKGLQSVTFDENSQLVTIGSAAFSFTGIKSIVIPADVTTIGYDAFGYCASLESITVESGNEAYQIAGNCFIETATKTLIRGFKDSVIPNDGSVTVIGDSAFYGCTGLVSIEIPASVTTIGYSAFSGCTGLVSIAIPLSVSTIGNQTFYGCTALASITIPASVTSIGYNAFYGCTGLQSIVFDENSGLTSIGGSAFYGCTALASITIPAGVTGIGDKAFYNCTGLQSVDFARNSRFNSNGIGSNAFYGCTSLASITIPEPTGLYSTIGPNAFSGCTGLLRVYFTGTESRWSSLSILVGNESLTSATRYYYSAEQPTASGNYWHYDQNGEIAIW